MAVVTAMGAKRAKSRLLCKPFDTCFPQAVSYPLEGQRWSPSAQHVPIRRRAIPDSVMPDKAKETRPVIRSALLLALGAWVLLR